MVHGGVAYSNILRLSQNKVCNRQRSFRLMVTNVEGRREVVHGRRGFGFCARRLRRGHGISRMREEMKDRTMALCKNAKGNGCAAEQTRKLLDQRYGKYAKALMLVVLYHNRGGVKNSLALQESRVKISRRISAPHHVSPPLWCT